MELSVLKNEEKRMNRIECLVNIVLPIAAVIFVMLFLQGTWIDTVALMWSLGSLLIRVFEKKLGGYAKYLYISLAPFFGPLILAITGDGKYGAMTHVYFLALLLGIVYEDIAERIHQENTDFSNITSMVQGNSVEIMNLSEQVDNINNMIKDLEEILVQ